MFEMIRRVFKIAGNSRGKIVAGIVCNILKSFFNGFMMFGVFWVLLHLDNLTPTIIGQAFCVILGSVLGCFFFQWMYDRTMSGSGYDIFRDYRLEIGDRLKQAPMGYFSEQNLGTIQAMLTTTIADLEGYSMLAIEQMTSGVAMAVLMSVMMFLFSPVIAGLSLVGLALGMLVLRRVRLRAAQYNRLYAYEKGEDGKPKIIQEQAEVVRSIYDQYLSGASLRMIKDRLEMGQIPNVTGGSQWTITAIRSILTNEKYCGDVLLQKTYISDCISRKVIRNTGQLPMYLVQNHHEGIVERKTFDAVQAEMARRSAGKSPSKKNAPTGMTSYASKYALSERLVCGECGTLYRRCTWSKQGRKRIVWRCVSRLDYGTKYCHNSPTLDEEPLQKAILAAINSVMSQKGTLIRQITSAMEMELAPVPGESMSLADIERRLGELNDQTRELVAESARAEDATACTAQLRAVMNEAAVLKEKRALIEEQRQSNAQAVRRIEDAAAAMAQASTHISEWDEALIRQLVDTVKVNSAEKITVFLRGGVQVEQDMI